MTEGKQTCCAQRRDVGPAPASVPVRAEARPLQPAIARRWSPTIGGWFAMGSDNTRFPDDGEGPVRCAMVSPFEISCHTVSNLQFGDFVRATGYTTDAERYGWSFVFAGLLTDEVKLYAGSRSAETPWWVPVPHAYWAQPEGPHSSALDRLDHPVVHVSWNDAQAYCEWSGACLPTEAQWEFAARGGLDQASYPWGNELNPEGAHRCNIWQGQFPDLNMAEDGYVGTAPIHAFEPNAYGLYNMAGNVWEWCEDYFSPRYRDLTREIDPLQEQPTPYRALRGGSFLCHASYCDRYRVAARSSNTPDSSTSNIGFRVVRRGTARSAA
jgi:formylglycine-generating enzyme required for sulfatase activity